MHYVNTQGFMLTDVVLFFASAPSSVYILKCLLKAYNPGSRGVLHAHITIALSYVFSIGVLLLIFYARLSWYEDIHIQMENANAQIEQLEADNRHNKRIIQENNR